MTVHPEGEALLVACRLDHDRAAVLAQSFHPSPEFVANAQGRHTDEDTRGDLRKPSCEMTSKTCRNSGQDEDYHGTSGS